MARRIRTYEEQIELLDQQISKAEEKLNNLMEQKEKLIDKKHKEELEDLYTVLKNNNLTIHEAENIIMGRNQLQSA